MLAVFQGQLASSEMHPRAVGGMGGRWLAQDARFVNSSAGAVGRNQ